MYLPKAIQNRFHFRWHASGNTCPDSSPVVSYDRTVESRLDDWGRVRHLASWGFCNALISSHYSAAHMKQKSSRESGKSYFGKQPSGVYLNEDNQIFPFKGCHTSKRNTEREAQRTRKMSGDTTHPMTIRRFPPTKYVKLNVGGSLHYTTIRTLSQQDSMLRAMFSGTNGSFDR